MNNSVNGLSRDVTITNAFGLHARAAAKIAKLVQSVKSKVWIIKEGEKADASSIIDILTLACEKGSKITLKIDDQSDLEILNKQLFDYSESAPIQIISRVKSGGNTVEFEIKKNMRKEFSILIKDAKEKINQELDSLKSKHEKINGNSSN